MSWNHLEGYTKLSNKIDCNHVFILLLQAQEFHGIAIIEITWMLNM